MVCRIRKNEYDALSTTELKPLGKIVNNTYILESFGACIGGLYYFSLGAIVFSPTANLFIINSIQCLCLLTFLAKRRQRTGSLLTGLFLFIYLLLLFISPTIEKHIVKNHYAPLQVKDSINTKYGQTVLVTQHNNEFSIFKDGIFQDETDNEYASEEKVYYGLLQFEKLPQNILLLGGSTSSALKISRIPNATITIVHPDKNAISFLVKKLPTEETTLLTSKNFNYIYKDIRFFTKECSDQYDYIIAAIPPPYTLGLNRFYTEEFFKDISAILAPGGVFSFTVPSSENLINDHLASFLKCIVNTAKMSFSSLLIIPGNTNVFLLANTPHILTNDTLVLNKRSEALPFKPHFVNTSYIPFRASNERISYLMDRIRNSSFLSRNTNLKPVAFYFNFVVWSSKTSQNLKNILIFLYSIPFLWATAVLIFLLCTLVFFLSKGKKDKYPVFFAIASLGFTEISLEIILILTYQSFFGYVYTAIALLIACYMAGLIIGSVSINHLIKTSYKTLLCFCSLSIVIHCLIIFSYLSLFSKLPLSLQSPFFLYGFILGAGVIGGAQFVAINSYYLELENNSERKIGSIYGIDMVGSACGAIMISLIFVPLYGILNTLVCLSLINICASILLVFKKHH
ncbi:hypothetical protein ACFL3D_05550 [Candidatus Omnitrophota bacterium]